MNIEKDLAERAQREYDSACEVCLNAEIKYDERNSLYNEALTHFSLAYATYSYLDDSKKMQVCRDEIEGLVEKTDGLDFEGWARFGRQLLNVHLKNASIVEDSRKPKRKFDGTFADLDNEFNIGFGRP